MAPGMGEANWWQPSAPNTIRKSEHWLCLIYSLIIGYRLYSLTTKSLAFSWQKIPYCCCNSRPKFKTQKLWTWVPLRTSCHRSESYIQHIHGGTTSMLVFNKKTYPVPTQYRKHQKCWKHSLLWKSLIYIYRPQNPVAYHHVSPWKIMFFTCGSCELYHFRAMFHFSS